MRVTFKLFASLTDHLPRDRAGNAITLDIAAGTTVADLVTRFDLPPRLVHLVLVDGVFVPPEQRATRVLRDGETLAIWPPVAGG